MKPSRTMLAAVVLGTALTGAEATAAEKDQAVSAIHRYCQACWRNAHLPADYWPDATQQVFIRLLERVAPERWTAAFDDESHEHREFLRAIDAVKKRTQRARQPSLLPDTVDDMNWQSKMSRHEARSWIEAHSARLLSERQQIILDLTFSGHEVPEIASKLGTTVARVSDEKYKAIRKLKAKHEFEIDA